MRKNYGSKNLQLKYLKQGNQNRPDILSFSNLGVAFNKYLRLHSLVSNCLKSSQGGQPQIKAQFFQRE